MKEEEKMTNTQCIKNQIAEYYNRYGSMVFRRCRRLLLDEDEAEDAMHEVFEKLLLYKKQIRTKELSNFLFKISTNVCLNKLRADRNHKLLSDNKVLAEIAWYDESEEKYFISSFLDYIFSREKKSTRDIAVMHFIEGMTLKTVAEEVGLSFAGVRKRLKGLRERAKKMEVKI